MPTPAYNTRVLSTPHVLVNGQTWAIIPNSLTVRLPGDAKVRAVSVGGGNTEPVVGLDATNLLAHIKFEVANTAQNMDRVRKVKADMIDGIYATVNIADPDSPMAFQQMVFSKDTEASWKADGMIPVEMEGAFVK